MAIQSQLHWFTGDTTVQTNLLTTGVTEFNQSFALSSFGLSTAIINLFDQYAIFAVYCRISCTGSVTSATSFKLFTAIDYDNTNNLGSENLIQAYSSVSSMDFGEVSERYIEPCNAPALYSGSAFSNFGVARTWCDSTSATTPHYGLRVLARALGSGSVGSLNISISYVVVARNSI